MTMRRQKPDDVPEPMSIKQFVFAAKRGTIFSAGAVAEACDQLPQELKDLRYTWEEWVELFQEQFPMEVWV